MSLPFPAPTIITRYGQDDFLSLSLGHVEALKAICKFYSRFFHFPEPAMTNGEIPHHRETNTGMNGAVNECASCGKSIKDKFLLKSMDKLFHADCLTCNCCSAKLGELGSSLYFKAGLILCRRDYLRMFGSSGYCSACNKEIQPYEFVMRSAKPNLVFHLNCFSCSLCNYRFCVGDRYYIENSKILCEYDHQERMIFKQMAYSPNLALLRRQVSQSGGGPGDEQQQHQQSHHSAPPQFPYGQGGLEPIESPPGRSGENAHLDKAAGSSRKQFNLTNGDDGANGYGSPDSGIRMDADYN